MMRRRLLPIGLILALPAGLLIGESDPWDKPDSKWRTGPVKYILTKEEDQAYKKLKTDPERAAFVEEFWSKRDPTPGTPANEYRDEYYRLAREAAAAYSEENGKGWQDDRGKVYILFGKPNETTEGTSLLGTGDSEVGSSSAGGGALGSLGGDSRPAPAKTVRFIYFDNPLTEKKGDRLELNFTGEVTGGFRLDERIDWSHPSLKGLVRLPSAPAAAAAAPPAATPPPAVPPPGSAPAPQEPPQPPPPEVTPQAELIRQMKGASLDASTAIPLDVTVNFYKASKGTFATLTLEIKKSSLDAGSDPAGLIVAAEINDAFSGESLHRFFQPDHFGGYEGNAGAGATDVLLYQAERPINPGTYNAIFAVKDPASGRTGKLEKELVVPSFEQEELTLSSVTLARKVEPLVTPPEAGKLVPFVLGGFKVVPRPDNLFKEGDALTFYYQIYGATVNPTTNAPKVDLSYAFEKNVSGTWKMVGGKPLLTPGQSLLVQAYSLPMNKWPAGEYRVSIQVTDTLSTPPRTATAQLPFTIEGPAGAAKSKAKAKSKG